MWENPSMERSATLVMVTGASSGIGEATVRRFVGEGARVIAVARRGERLRALANELGPTVRPVELDVRDRDAVAALMEGLPPEWAAIDVLVNGAGLARGLAPAQAASLDDWDEMIDTNVKGLAYVTRAVLPGMVARGRGHVINIGSVAGTYPYPGANAYGGSKAFVEQFSLALRADLHGSGVRVTNIEPGMVETEFSEVRFHGDQERAAAVYRGTVPLTGDDVAACVCWCASLPPHVNVNRLEVMPTAQSFAGFAVARDA
jgi:3-hydroxy acid dehydrogenase/malonic semialdehyde reductase